MKGEIEILFLGSGTSHGVPMIGCDCGVCAGSDPADKRFRTSVAVTLAGGEVILIDVSPEFRLAAIANRLPRVDAVLLTHAHADHVMGMDDLRRFNNILGTTIPVYGAADTLERVQACFGYAVARYDNPDRPSLSLHRLDGEPVEVCGATVQPVPLIHGRRRTLGYRIGDFAYCTDVSAIPPQSMALLEGLDLLVLGALRYTPHPAHFNVEQALEAINQIRPRRALLTHIAHEILHAAASAKLPPDVAIAVDGMRVKASSAQRPQRSTKSTETD